MAVYAVSVTTASRMAIKGDNAPAASGGGKTGAHHGPGGLGTCSESELFKPGHYPWLPLPLQRRRDSHAGQGLDITSSIAAIEADQIKAANDTAWMWNEIRTDCPCGEEGRAGLRCNDGFDSLENLGLVNAPFLLGGDGKIYAGAHQHLFDKFDLIGSRFSIDI